MRRFFCFVVVVLSVVPVLILPAVAESKHPFTFEDMMSLKRVGEPIVSSDGKWVLFSAVDANLEANTKTPHVWVVPTAGGEPRQIVSNQDADRPRWAPDGKRFLFLSTKEGGSQIWIADFDGAKSTVNGTHKLTSIATEADGPIWSPDGKNILFISNVYPECSDEACNAKKVEEADQSKVKALIFTHLLYRHWNAYKAGKRNHLLIISVDGGASRDLTPGDHDVPPFSLGGQDDYAFSPDGQEVCYTSNHDEVGALSTNNDLFIVSVNGGAAKKITDNPASDSSPLYSPDGKYIAYRAQVRPGYESDRFRLMLYNRRGGHIRNLTESFDRWVGTYTWDPDSSKIYFVAEEKGDSPVYSIALDTAVIGGDAGNDTTLRVAKNNIRMIVPGHNDDVAVTHDGKTLLFTRMSVKFPSEIFRATLSQPGTSGGGGTVFETQEVCTDSSGKTKPEGCKSTAVEKSEAQLTDLNHAVLSRVSMSPLESFWFTGASNDKVEVFLIKPTDFDAKKKYPVK